MPTSRQPLEVLYSGLNDSTDGKIEIDIVAVHGLGSNVDWSWIWKDGNKKVHWLRDPNMLPAVMPTSRIMTYSYESRWHADAPKTRLELCGEGLATSLHSFRTEELDRPILFIAHSLGGLVVLHALLYADHTNELKYLPQKTIGFVALGTPFKGTRMQPLAEIVRWSLKLFGSHGGLLTDLKPDDKHLNDKVHEFCQLRNKLNIPSHCFFELFQSDYRGKLGIPWVPKRVVVEEASAHIPGWGRTGLNTDHFNLNKYSGPDDGSFMAVSSEVRLMYARIHASAGPPSKRREIEHSSNDDTEERLKQVLDTLYFKEIDARRQNVPLANQDTCTWILETAQYNDWVNPTEGSMHDDILWIKGKPGVGKSTIMNLLYEESTSIMPNAKKLSFFFNARGKELEKTTLGLYRALLWGILRTFNDLIKAFDEVDLEFIKTGGWKEQPLRNLLEQVVGRLGDRPLVCYIDALDECPEDQVRHMVTHFRRISKRATESGSRFKLCFSSRHYPNISIGKSIGMILEDQSQHESDIRRYIDSELIHSVEVVDRKQAIRIQDKLLQKSSSVFLYVKLVIDRVKRDFDQGGADMKTLEGRLNGLPQGLSALYDEILKRNSTDDPEDREATHLCLQWVLFATSPMSPDQLYFAIQHGLHEDTNLAYIPDDEEYETLSARMHRFIISSSKGLVEIVYKKDYYRRTPGYYIPQFIHESVRDYLLSERGYRELYPSLSGSFAGKSHDKLKQICYEGVQLVARHQEPGSEVPKSALLNPFLSHYVIYGTFHHAEKAQSFGAQQRDFLSDFSVNTWLKAYRYFRPEFRGRDEWMGSFDLSWKRDAFVSNTNQANSQLLYILAMANLPYLIRAHPDRARHMEIKGGKHGIPLVAAISAKNHECVKELGLPASREELLTSSDEMERLNYGPIDKLGQPVVASCGNILYDLIRVNCLPTVKILADGKDLNRYEPGIGRPLYWAVYFKSLDVVRWLLSQEKVDPMIQDYSADELIGEDEKTIQDDMLPILFKKGNGKSPLHYLCATCSGFEDTTCLEMLRIFLACPRIPSIEIRDGEGRTLFSYAVETRFYRGARMLFETGLVDADSKSNCGRSPLSYASEGATSRDQDLGFLEWLLSLDTVDPESRDANGRTPLSYAAKNRYHQVMEVFVKFGLGKLTPGRNRGFDQSKYGKKRASGKIDFDSRDNSGRTPLRWVIEYRNYIIVQLLLETGEVDPKSEANDGLTPLDVIKSHLGGYRDFETCFIIKRMELYVLYRDVRYAGMMIT